MKAITIPGIVAIALAASLGARPSADEVAPQYRDVTVPAGTVLPIALDSYVASDMSRIEDRVQAHVRRAIAIDGVTVIPAGSPIVGHVTRATRAGRVKGRGQLAFRFTRLSAGSPVQQLAISTSTVARQAPATKKKDAATIAIPAAGGAVIGALTGGKKGAAIGAAAGGGGGTAVVLSTRGRDVRLGRGAIASVRLLRPVTIRVRR
jgi:hypothetical protein